MKFTISREAFLKPLMLVVSVVERRQTLPVLSNVLIHLNGDQLSLTGTDLEVEIVGYARLEQPGESGEITVPARKLVDICKSLPDKAEISFSEDAGRMIITSGRSRFTLSTLPASEFPTVEEGAGQVEFNLAGSTLKKLLEDTAFAMAQQDVRYYLNGMLWEAAAGTMRAVATDGHRLALSQTEMPFDLPEKIQAIVPRKGVMELSRILNDDEQIGVVIGANHVRVQSPEFRFTSKLIDGAYPDYERVLPRAGTKFINGQRETLRQAFARAAILSNEKYRGVRLQIEGNLLKITANNPEQEEAEEEVVIEFEGDGDLEIGFNVNYLLDALNALSGERARISLTDANSSALMESPDYPGALYVIMPMRL